MIHVARLTDEEFALIKKALDLLANDKNFSRSMMKGLFLGQAPDAASKAELEKVFRQDEEKEKRENEERFDKITTIQYKLLQLKKFLAAKPGISPEAFASDN